MGGRVSAGCVSLAEVALGRVRCGEACGAGTTGGGSPFRALSGIKYY